MTQPGLNEGNPHDRFFKNLIAQPGAARALLQERLPPQIAAKLRIDTARAAPTNYLSPDLEESNIDFLVDVETVDGDPVSNLVLIEHKSTPERVVLMQLLWYLVQIYSLLIRTKRFRSGLPDVVPMIVYHGSKPWNVPLDFGALTRGRTPSCPRPLDFEYVLVDLEVSPDATLSAHPVLRAGLLALKYVARANSRAKEAENLVRALQQTPRRFRKTAITYMIEAGRVEFAKNVIKIAKKIIPEEAPMYQTMQDYLLKKGEANVLLRQLAERFGTLTLQTTSRIRAATVEQLERGSYAVLNAQSLDEVLDAVFARQQ